MFIKEKDFVVKNIFNTEEKFQAYRLRHKIFCEELNWVGPSKSKLEIDRYDKNSIFFGVFDKENKLLAFLRLIHSRNTFMLENEFDFLISPSYNVRKESDTVELSRLCIDPEVRRSFSAENFGLHRIALFLYKGVYHWSYKNGVRFMYIVIKLEFLRLLRLQGFSFELIGKPVTMPDNVTAVASILDWQKFEKLNSSNNPELLRWLKQGQPIPVQQPQLQPEFSLSHQASA